MSPKKHQDMATFSALVLRILLFQITFHSLVELVLTYYTLTRKGLLVTSDASSDPKCSILL